MEKLNILGTGHAMTLDCYNTCFTLENNEGEHILVDAGGGLQIIKQLRDANIDFRKIHNIILSQLTDISNDFFRFVLRFHRFSDATVFSLFHSIVYQIVRHSFHLGTAFSLGAGERFVVLQLFRFLL